MFSHLLVPLDGSQAAETAVPVAAWLAEKAAARVTLLHVIERHAKAEVHGQRHLTEAAEAERCLQQIARERFSPGTAVDWHVHTEQIDQVAQSVAEHAKELTPDLIVMLSHGERRLAHRLFGTIPQQIVRRTLTPILLLHPDAAGRVAMPFRRIVVPLDGREEHESVLVPSADIARLCGAELRLVMIVPRLGEVEGDHAAAAQLLPAATTAMLDIAERGGVDYLAQLVARLRGQGLACSAAVARGNPLKTLSELIEKEGADLVAMGTHGAAGAEAFWSGSLGQKLIDRTAASFLLSYAREATDQKS